MFLTLMLIWVVVCSLWLSGAAQAVQDARFFLCGAGLFSLSDLFLLTSLFLFAFFSAA